MEAGEALHTVPNAAIARALREIADALDIEGANPFRVRAYRNAAQCLDTLGQPVAELAARGGREAVLIDGGEEPPCARSPGRRATK